MEIWSRKGRRMSEFKIGEKVLLVDTRLLYPRHVREGGIYSVLKVNGDFITLTDDAKSFSECVYAHRLYKIVLLDKEKEMEQTAEQIRNEILRIDVRIEEAKKDIENAETERSVLVEKLREKGFSLTMNPQPIVRYSKGDKLIVVGNTTLHRFPNGTVVTVIKDGGNYYDCKDRGGMVWSCHGADVVKFK